MADSTIPNLSAFTGTPNGTEVIETVQSGASVKIPSQKIADLATIVTPINLAGMTSLISGSQVSVYKLYVITNSTQGRILVKGLSTTTLEAGALNLTTGASGTYVFGTDTFTPSAGGNANVTPITVTALQNLRSTSALSTTTLYNVTNAVSGTLVLQVYAIANNTNVVYAIDVATGEIGTYNITTDAFTVAVPSLEQVTTLGGSTTSVGITVDNGAGESIDIKHDQIIINNVLGNATITSPTLTTATEFRIPNKATNPQTFAMLSDIVVGSGTVTSVGLSMPSAFSVASSPVTTSGTIAVTGAGVTSQYVRGDGSLANFPTSGGGGASVNYYLNGSVAQGTLGGVAFKQMSSTPVIGAGTDFSINADGYIQSFITDASMPNQLLIPAGNWNFEMYFSANSNGGSPRFYIELYKLSAGTLSLIASNSATPEYITNGINIDLYTTAVAIPSTVLLAADRLAIRVYVIHSSKIITLHTENSHLCQVITTFTTGLTALNGLTEQVQTFAVGTTGSDFAISSASGIHNFNLPTASASNRGALSSADWSAFNGKQATLVNGTNIKSVEGSTLLGSAPIVVAREIQVACSDETTALTAGTAKVTFRAPRAMVITGVRASLTTAQTSGSILTVDINEGGTSILSPKLTIDNNEKTSVTATTPPVISDTAIADDAEITIDIDIVGDGTAKGLKVTILYTI